MPALLSQGCYRPHPYTYRVNLTSVSRTNIQIRRILTSRPPPLKADALATKPGR